MSPNIFKILKFRAEACLKPDTASPHPAALNQQDIQSNKVLHKALFRNLNTFQDVPD